MDALSRSVATFILNSLWQVTLVAALGLLGDLLLRRGAACYRHIFWIVALAGAIILPFSSTRSRPPQLATMADSGTALSGMEAGKLRAAVPLQHSRVRSKRAWLRKLSPAGNVPMLAVPRTLQRAALLFYFCAVAFTLARFGRAWGRTREIRRRASVLVPSPQSVRDAVERSRNRMAPLRSGKRTTPPLILSSDDIPGPVTVGVRSPAIILPAALLEPSMREDLTAALAHEMAHVYRRDYLWNLVYELLILPVALHPLARLILRRIGDTRELACDELAAQVMTTSVYARSLVRMAHQMSRRAGAALAPNYTLGVFDANILEERVMKLMKPRASGRLAKLSLFSAAVLVSAVSFATARFSIRVAQPARSGASAQTGDSQALSALAGTWAGKFDGKTYALLQLKPESGRLAGMISLGATGLDANAKVSKVVEEVHDPRPIVLANSDGSKFYFKDRGDDNKLIYEIEMTDAEHARLTVSSHGEALPTFDLVKETGSVGSSDQATVRNVVYTDTAHAVKGEVSGGIPNGLAGGTSGGVPGGVSGGAVGGVGDGVPGATSRVQGGEVPAKNEEETKTGSLSGIVVDSSGARIPNADIRLVSRTTSFQKATGSDETGNFSFEDIPAGRYTLDVTSPGMGGTFRSFEFKAEGAPPFFPFVLHPGSVSETVSVTAKSPHDLGDKAVKVAPRRIRVGGEVEAAKLVDGPPPSYPEAAKSRGAQGVVALVATISATGTVKDLKVVSSPDDDLTKAALDGVSKWRYQPTLLNGEPVEVVTTIDVNFTLQN